MNSRQVQFVAVLLGGGLPGGPPLGVTAFSEVRVVPTVARSPQSEDRGDPRCAIPIAPTTVRTDGRAVLLVWTFPDDSIYSASVLPPDSAYLAYRAQVRAHGADRRSPIADRPTPNSDDEARVWQNERANNDLAQGGEVGTIEPIRCLDALLFSYQHARFSELTQPTEFVASVLRKEVDGQSQLTVVFGAGAAMFPPKTVYGFDVAEEYVRQGWRYLYVLHNHTIQHNGDRLALGAPALSTSDVQLMRSVAAETSLESARVTNGFYTYVVAADDLDELRSR